MGISLLEEYERVLLTGGKFLQSTVKTATSGSVLELYRYAFSSLLGWSPEKTRTSMSFKILKFMRLEEFLPKIPCPAELDAEVDLFYIAEAMYPQHFPVRTEERVAYTYERLRSGEIGKFPKKFFTTCMAPEFACTCLRLAIMEDVDAADTEALYKMFANTTWAKNFLKQESLLRPCITSYDSPVAFLHAALPEEDKNEALYRFVRFAAAWKKVSPKAGKFKKAKIKVAGYESLPIRFKKSKIREFKTSLPEESELKNYYSLFIDMCKKYKSVFIIS